MTESEQPQTEAAPEPTVTAEKLSPEAVAELKTKVEALYQQKEEVFARKRKISEQISKLVGDVKSSKSNRNQFTKQVQDSKKKRDTLSKEISDKINAVKELNKEKRELAKKAGVAFDPVKLKKEIEDIEFQMETEAWSFSKEKAMMTKLKEKKAQLKKCKGLGDVAQNINKLSEEIKQLKHDADSAHRSIQSKAEDSQQHHESMISTSKQLKELRDKEKAALEEFLKIKEEYNALNTSLRGAVGEERKERKIKVERKRKDAEKQAKEAQKKKEKELTEQKKEVEEKIKTKKKLTTEDLLIMQAQSR